MARLWRLIKYPGHSLSDRTLLRPLRTKHWDLLRGPHALALEQATCGPRMSPRRAAPSRGAILSPWGRISKWPVAHGLVLACKAEKGEPRKRKNEHLLKREKKPTSLREDVSFLPIIPKRKQSYFLERKEINEISCWKERGNEKGREW